MKKHQKKEDFLLQKVSRSFFKTPKELYSDPEFASLSSDAKMLFTMILDRTELSYKNKERFTDENGEVFIYFTIEQICQKLGCSNKKAIRLLQQLSDSELIVKKRKGNNLPTRIYLSCKADKLVFNTPRVCKNDISESDNNSFRNVSKQHTINTDNNNNDINNTESSIIFDDVIEEVKEQIEYDCINGDSEIIDELVLIIADVYTYPANVIRIGGVPYPKSFVVERYKLLCAEHIEDVVYQINNVGKKVMNMRNFIMSVLFNAPTTYASAAAAEFAFHTANDRR